MWSFLRDNIIAPYRWVAEGIGELSNRYGIIRSLLDIRHFNLNYSFDALGAFFISLCIVVIFVCAFLMVFYGLNRDRWNHAKNKTGTCFTWAMILFGYICGKFIAPYRLPYSAISQQQTVQMVSLLIGAFSAFFSYAAAIIGAFIAILVNRGAPDKGTHPAWIVMLFIMPVLVSAFARYGMLAINAAAWLFILYVLSPVFLFVFLSRVIFPPED